MTPFAEKATEDALQTGCAILKFISPNDVGLTGGHQCGYYLPKKVWKLFTVNSPTKGQNKESFVIILWQDGRETKSRVIWYGTGSRSEYRLTRFGRDFPFLTHDCVGNLLVLVPQSMDKFHAYVLEHEEDIEGIQSALGILIMETWAAYICGKQETTETPDECVERKFREFAKKLAGFPSTKIISKATLDAIEYCIKTFSNLSYDDRLMELIQKEYRLFRLIERQVCQSEIIRPFKDVDDFLATASSILNRRKSRAGRSLENHFEFLLRQAEVPFEARPRIDGTDEPDILIPSKAAYENSSYDVKKLCMIGLKTTCKDRWRQVTREAQRIPQKHILTLQNGISPNQLVQMREANVALIVPESLQKMYPTKDTGIKMFTVNDFIKSVAAIHGRSNTPKKDLFE
jgi:EcoRII C terminal/Restriction endonuclease EcoRII, N-terminal